MSQPGWACPACRQLTMGPGDCPKCLKFRRYVKVVPLGRGGALRMAQVRADDLPRVAPSNLLFPGISEAMNFGFVLGSVTLVWGGPGVGKSRLLLQLANAVVVTGHEALYVATEQPPEHVKATATLVGVGESSFLVTQQRYPDALALLITEERPSFVVIDSIQGMLDEPSALVQTTKRLVQMAREYACAMVLVFHETKDGDYAGARTVEHDVDAMVSLDRSPDGVSVEWTVSGKYRFGPSGRYAILHEIGGRFHDRGEVFYRRAGHERKEDRSGTPDGQGAGSPTPEPTP